MSSARPVPFLLSPGCGGGGPSEPGPDTGTPAIPRVVSVDVSPPSITTRTGGSVLLTATPRRELNGALYPMRFDEYVIATGEPLRDVSGGWATAEVNVPLPVDYLSPPPEPETPLARMLNAAYLARSFPPEALAWYRDFRTNPATAGIDTEAGMEALGYQCLKNGSVETAVLLLEANLADYPGSADAHFGLGRAYRAAGREAGAVERFQAALEIDPSHSRAAEALRIGSP